MLLLTAVKANLNYFNIQNKPKNKHVLTSNKDGGPTIGRALVVEADISDQLDHDVIILEPEREGSVHGRIKVTPVSFCQAIY